MTKCHHCDNMFFSFGEVQKHIKEAHTGMKCESCGKMFIQIDDLKAHTQKFKNCCPKYVLRPDNRYKGPTNGNIITLSKSEISSNPGISKTESPKPGISKEDNYKTKDSDELTQDQVVKTVGAKNVSYTIIF